MEWKSDGNKKTVHKNPLPKVKQNSIELTKANSINIRKQNRWCIYPIKADFALIITPQINSLRFHRQVTFLWQSK